MLLRNIGNLDLDDSTVKSAEKFICKIYNTADEESSAMKRAQRCSLDVGHRKLFRRQVMQHDII